MLFRRRKQKRDRFPMPDWMKWAALAFLGLAFLGNRHHSATNAPNTIPEAFHNAESNLNPSHLLPLSSYKNILRKSTSQPPSLPPKKQDDLLEVKDTAPGAGMPAVCGQHVVIAYKVYDKNDTLIDAGQTTSFTIGEDNAAPALEQGVVGMKKGGKRMILSADKRFKAEMLDIKPSIPDTEATPYHIATVAPGNGTPVLCGKPAKFQVTLWSADGKKLFSTKDKGQPIGFTPGRSQVFLGLEQGVIGMREGEMRTLIVPPSYQKTMNGNPPATDFPLPKDQTVLVDVVALP